MLINQIKDQLKSRDKSAIAVYGITKNPTKNEHMIVMQYSLPGSYC